MVRFADELYVSEHLTSKVSSIKWKMACGIGMVNTYFITMSLSSKDLFDIYSATMFKQRAFRKSDLYIIGIASDMEEARDIVKNMIDDCIRDTGSVNNIRQYFKAKYDRV